MSRRDLSQPSFVEAMVSGCRKSGGFLDRIEQAFDWPAFEALLASIHASTRGAPGYLGLARNACHLRFVVAAMNMKRALVLMEQN